MKCCSVLALAIALSLVWAVPATADRMDDLEKLVQQMAEQNRQLQEQVQSLQEQVEELKAPRAVPAEAQQPAAEEKRIRQFVGPGTTPEPEADGPRHSFGADIRLRGVSMDNLWNMGLPGGLNYDDSWEWIRMRSRAFVHTELPYGLSGYLRGANEYKWGIDSKANTLLIDPDFDPLIGNKEWFVDSAYIDWKAPLGFEPLSLRLGRQDLIYGEGLVILDGQSNVGSMAIGFDAVKATLTLHEETKTSVDILYSKIFENTKQYADDEDLYGLYARTDVFAPLHLEPYLLHRNRNAVDAYTLPGGVWPSPPLSVDTFIDPKQHTTLLGLRGVLPLLDAKLQLVGEGGYQWGKIEQPVGLAFANTDSYGRSRVDRRAWAATGYAKYTWKDLDWKPYVKTGYVFLSGDDPDTKKYEGWDSFYAEWPIYSEGMIYHLYDPFIPLKMTQYGPTDRDLGSWTNMKIAQLEGGFSPLTGLTICGSFQYLWAAEENSLINPSGDERGSLVTGIITYQFNKYLSGHLRGEYFKPGDFYEPKRGADPDEAFFARYELMLKY